MIRYHTNLAVVALVGIALSVMVMSGVSRGAAGVSKDARPEVWIGVATRGGQELLFRSDVKLEHLNQVLLQEFRKHPVPLDQIGTGHLDEHNGHFKIKLLRPPLDEPIPGGGHFFAIIVDAVTGEVIEVEGAPA